MRSRTVLLLTLASLAWIAWFASAMAVERHRRVDPTIVHPADLQLCVPLRPAPPPPPLLHRRSSPNHPSETA